MVSLITLWLLLPYDYYHTITIITIITIIIMAVALHSANIWDWAVHSSSTLTRECATTPGCMSCVRTCIHVYVYIYIYMYIYI